MQDKHARLVPQLRFPEFLEEADWTQAKFDELVEIVIPPRKLKTTEYLVDGQFQIVDQSQSYISGWTNDSEAVIKKQLPVIVFGDHTCVLKLIHQPFVQGADGIKIFRASSGVTTEYLYHFLSHNPLISQEYKRHFSSLRNKVIYFPDIKSSEQKKISDCLGSLDDLIAAENSKIEALRKHKKGLMQQFFPQLGENVPRLRFPEFGNDRPWLVTAFTDLYKFKSTNSLSRDKLNYDGGEIRNIHYGDIHTKYKSLFRLVDEQIPYINQDSLGQGFDDGAFCEEGDIVLADASEDLDDVGKTIEVVSLDGKRVVAGIHTILATRRGEFPIIGFGGQLFQSKIIRDRIKREAQGTKVYGISAKRVSTIPITIPPTAEEQQKIADCLGTMDGIIAASDQKLETLRQHKKGLIQQLFLSQEN